MIPKSTTCLVATTTLLLWSCSSTPDPEPVAKGGETSTPSAEVQAPTTDPARPGIKTLYYKVQIDAPVEKVWDTMTDLESYKQWTVPFMAGSYFEGTWKEGERMRFLAPGNSGMVAEIAANRPHELISIKHLGYVMNGKEDTTSSAVKSWAPAFENYHFASIPGGTEVTIEHENLVAMEGYMNNTWPKALDALKSLCESN